MVWELATFPSDLLPSQFDVEGADMQVVRPGEPVRVTHVLDAVEPRIRPDGRAAFPTEGKAGAGRTNRLDGVVVLSCLDFAAEERPLHEQESIVDLAGPGAEFTPFAHETCVVLTFRPGEAGN
jgi:glycine reductase